MKIRSRASLLVAFAGATSWMAVVTGPVLGTTTFVVNRTGDAADLNLANTKCDTSSASGKQCTLRAAIQEANDTPGADTINFNITSASKVIAPGSPLPPVTEQVTINGYSQSGASPNTQAVGNNAVLKIVLDGINAGTGSHGLDIEASNSAIRGLVIQRFDGSGVMVRGSSNVLRGNFLGTNAAGTAARGNDNGVSTLNFAFDNVIGGTAPADRNLISGNGQRGVYLFGSESDNTVQGNYIGTNAAGTAALGNGDTGVYVLSSDNVIGGTVPGARNVISGNAVQGVFLSGSGNVVQGNYVGTNAAGTAAMGNGLTGVLLQSATENVIGGTVTGARNVISGNGGSGVYIAGGRNTMQGNLVGTKANGTGDLGNGRAGVKIFGVENIVGGAGTGAGNVIAGNDEEGVSIVGFDNQIRGNTIRSNGLAGLRADTGPNTVAANVILQNGTDGVQVSSGATSVRITANQIFANSGLGIDLEGGTEDAAGVTSNDTDDPDTGANNLQNFPVLSSAMRNSQNGITTVIGTLNSNPSTAFRIELFFVAADPSNHGEGQVFLASQNITTKANGNRSFSIPVAGLSPGHLLTATATSSTVGNTSEFSANLSVVSGP